MKFLVDQKFVPRVAELLDKAGHDAVHVRDLQASSAPDHEIVSMAAAQGRIIVSADTDFGALLAHRRAKKPSVLLVRQIAELPPPELVDVIVRHLDVLQAHLDAGAGRRVHRPGSVGARVADPVKPAGRLGQPARVGVVLPLVRCCLAS